MAINAKKAIADLSQIRIKGNEEGLIPFYGLLINQLPTRFWNLFTVKILQAAGDQLYDDATGLLENAAAECGYHTGYGIINSEEFKAVVGPMIQHMPEDVLHGLYAVIASWGWAKAEIVQLIPDELMIVRAYDYYEAEIKEIWNPTKPSAFMLKAISRTFMDLAYSDAYPNGLGKFKSVQTKGIELGDFYGEFIVTRA
jgi:hypothetical protein